MIWAKKRFKVLQRDNFRCQYCWKNWKDVSLEVDHIIPKSKWWTDEFENLITCCRECNIGKWDEIIWVSIDIAKIKISEHENAMVKKFFTEWNLHWFWTIDKRNLTFVSWFLKFFYGDYLMKYIKSEIIERRHEITMEEFNKWEWKCEKALDEVDRLIWGNEIEDLFEQLEDNDLRKTDDINMRLNRVISEKMVWLEFPKSFNYKYSLFPNKIEEWQNDMEEQLEWLKNH